MKPSDNLAQNMQTLADLGVDIVDAEKGMIRTATGLRLWSTDRGHTFTNEDVLLTFEVIIIQTGLSREEVWDTVGKARAQRAVDAINNKHKRVDALVAGIAAALITEAESHAHRLGDWSGKPLDQDQVASLVYWALRQCELGLVEGCKTPYHRPQN
jgi:hypothetical protein